MTTTQNTATRTIADDVVKLLRPIRLTTNYGPHFFLPDPESAMHMLAAFMADLDENRRSELLGGPVAETPEKLTTFAFLHWYFGDLKNTRIDTPGTGNALAQVHATMFFAIEGMLESLGWDRYGESEDEFMVDIWNVAHYLRVQFGLTEGLT